MNSINFLTPVIALALVVLLFIYLLKKSGDKGHFKRFVFTTLVLTFLLNFAWEVIQMPLYQDAAFDVQHVAFCALVSMRKNNIY